MSQAGTVAQRPPFTRHLLRNHEVTKPPFYLSTYIAIVNALENCNEGTDSLFDVPYLIFKLVRYVSPTAECYLYIKIQLFLHYSLIDDLIYLSLSNKNNSR